MEVDEEDLYTLKINCKGKKQQEGKQRNKCRKNNKFKKIKNIKKRREKMEEERKKKKKKRKTQNCKSPMQRQMFITTIKSVTEHTHTYIHP